MRAGVVPTRRPARRVNSPVTPDKLCADTESKLGTSHADRVHPQENTDSHVHHSGTCAKTTNRKGTPYHLMRHAVMHSVENQRDGKERNSPLCVMSHPRRPPRFRARLRVYAGFTPNT
ncbi:hypothetical protein EVAR_81162_1 [Eumeta japonica]|uniref:Uncharacterized protein n=1 Tax=Eumeta variegata TaxID=151549 RepID=A0A4C1UL37_EUMVA|nr:hypothetical protein EVAR_81162_1 [Eumeta japonica]